MAMLAPDWLAGKRNRLLADDIDTSSREDLRRRIERFLAHELPSHTYDYFDRALLQAKRDLLNEQLALLDGRSSPARVQDRERALAHRQAVWLEHEEEKRPSAERRQGARAHDTPAAPPLPPRVARRPSSRAQGAATRSTPQRGSELRALELRHELRQVDHALAELDPNAVVDMSTPLEHKVALTPIWEEMRQLGRDRDPQDDLMHLADLDREEMEVYRTEYPAWYRLARQSSEETRAWRRERREEWAHLVDRRLELESELAAARRPAPRPAQVDARPALAAVPESRTPSPPGSEPTSPYTVQAAHPHERRSSWRWARRRRSTT